MEVKKLNHLAIIMDGNRRWAKVNGRSVPEGHRAGAEKIKELCQWALDAQVKILTLFAFSTENWKRSPEEVAFLMSLIEKFLAENGEELIQKGGRLSVIGRRDRLAKSMVEKIEDIESRSRGNEKGWLRIAIDYGGRNEITDAVRKLIREKIEESAVTEEFLSSMMYDPCPDPDLIVRTSGELRLSGFLLWQSAYAEFLFLNKHWPALGKGDFDSILEEFAKRERRYGK
ncbi:MAG: undecaprenyl diphosphate synthase [Parcubacteria group bacterium Gr01-1014_18]|nr:MAG: undecaprenyl diphosphate synthase [Parcubacteria group bacterium Greene0416_36]TSC81125.1 MAG: undecaprenyl diphosphate synthase [Parcubacteria group bacterium Gr01-1014_18]TSC98458.1 MAG: undecaprenyl diphosphate synthase [Parcubacteria group bacterium Greene1014_20]TSD07376.1 MAG: undecaprenyl diphosphate synthase [Parcubacteria group bacterium Greene0714_2]